MIEPHAQPIPDFRWWLQARLPVFIVLCILPFTIYSASELLAMWVIPLMAICAAAIPSSGTPVAGGIVFLPVLQMYGVCPRDAVAFSAATQFFGCGIFSPLNWMAQDASVFVPAAIHIAFLPSAIGLCISLALIGNDACRNDLYVLGMFGAFCFVLSLYVGHGLARGLHAAAPAPVLNNHRPDGFLGNGDASSNSDAASPKRLVFDSCLWFQWFVPCVIGGMLTGWIGGAPRSFELLIWRAHPRARAPCLCHPPLFRSSFPSNRY